MKTLKAIMNAVKSTMKKIAIWILVRQKVARMKLAEERGDFVIDHAVVFIIIVFAAGVVIFLLNVFLRDDFSPALREKILGLFSLS